MTQPPGDAAGEPIEANPIWHQDHVTLHSVGIDIGSSGTQVAFSRLALRRMSEDLTSRYVVVHRETLFQSPVTLTPYASERLIDGPRLRAIIDAAYEASGQHPQHIDTGVVILTGEALRRDNAAVIAEILAAKGGDLVCASAGHHMEARLAAYGCGAARVSHDRQIRILNVDIGGGTTKFALVDRGTVVATAAIHVGGRLVTVDGDGTITHLYPAGRRFAARAGVAWSPGTVASPEDLDRVAQEMADAVVSAATSDPPSPSVADLYLTEAIGPLDRLDGLMFSGGVGEYVYDREHRDFGDLGRRLGAALRARVDAGAWRVPVLPAVECIRATVLGASEYSVQLSGNTIYISEPGTLLPRRNLQVLRPPYELGQQILSGEVAAAISAHLTAFDTDGTDGDLALALTWEGPPSYARIRGFAEGIIWGLADRIASRRPLYLLLDGDVALSLGRVLRAELRVANELLIIDGLSLWDFDYVDLGTVRQPSNTVPVTIKSLVFTQDPRSAVSDIDAGRTNG